MRRTSGGVIPPRFRPQLKSVPQGKLGDPWVPGSRNLSKRARGVSRRRIVEINVIEGVEYLASELQRTFFPDVKALEG
jgi:hypothetical protein